MEPNEEIQLRRDAILGLQARIETHEERISELSGEATPKRGRPRGSANRAKEEPRDDGAAQNEMRQ